MTQILYLMTLATAAMSFAALVVLLYRYQSFGYFAILGVFFVDAVFLVSPSIELAGFNVTLLDVVGASVFTAGLIRLAFRRLRIIHTVWGVFALIALFSFYTGFRLFGPKSPGLEFRGPFFFLAAATYCSSFDVTTMTLRRLQQAWYITAGALICLAAYRWLALSFGLPTMDTWTAASMGSVGGITRVLWAAPTLFLFQGWLLSGPSVRFRRPSAAARAGAFLLLGFVFIMQHRTVWIAAIVSVVFLFGRLRTLVHRPVWLSGAVAIAVAVLVLVSVDKSNPLATSLQEAVSEPTHARSTFEWRVTGWRQLVFDDNSPSTTGDLLLGSHPYGSGLRRRVEGAMVNYSAHNEYVEIFMRMGLLGLAAFLAGYGILMWKIRRVRWEDSALSQQWRVILTSIIVSQLVYFLGYGAGYEQGILLGVAVSFTVRRSRGVVRAGAANRLAGIRPPLGEQRLPGFPVPARKAV